MARKNRGVRRDGECSWSFKLLSGVRLSDVAWEVITEKDDTIGKDPAASR